MLELVGCGLGWGRAARHWKRADGDPRSSDEGGRVRESRAETHAGPRTKLGGAARYPLRQI